jgi:CheY-like chemotaxis protein
MSESQEHYRVLVVEDDEATRYAWTRLLQRHGYAVTAVDSVTEALASLPGGFDVLLSDQRLPDGDGADLVRRAMEQGLLTTTSTLLCTAYHPADLQNKPVSNEDLLAAVERGAREARQLQHLQSRRGSRRS